MAAVGGLEYLNNANFGSHWLKYLPKQVAANSSLYNETAWTLACSQQKGPQDWEYPHRNPQIWAVIRSQIITDTRTALQLWALENNRQLPQFEATDVVIQLRCARDAIFTHNEYGPTAFSLYRHIPASTERIFIVEDRVEIIKVGICIKIREALIDFIRNLHPHAEILSVGDDAFTDFARLVYAPVLFKEASSFGVAAAMANNGTVWTPPLHPAVTFENPGWS